MAFLKIIKTGFFYSFLLLSLQSHCFTASNTEPLVEIQSINPMIRVDAAFRSKTTPSSRCYLRKTAAKQLNLVQKELESLGLGLKIIDAYRPLSKQKELWKKCPDSRYVANPIHGSRHNRGAAVDVRLVRLRDGKELSMPTTTFSKACHRNYAHMQTDDMKKNCKLLELVMEKHGFIPLPTEWWHFDYKEWYAYNVLDISFKELAARSNARSLAEQAPKSVVNNKPKKPQPQKKKKRKKRKHKKTQSVI